MYCRCPKCRELFGTRCCEFGCQHACSSCGNQFNLDTDHIAHFELPQVINVRLVDKSGLPVRLGHVNILVTYGYTLPLLQTDDEGSLTVTVEMFQKAEADEISTGIMDHKGDYTLNRYVTVAVPSAADLQAMGRRRRQSGWVILPFEQELYGDLDRLCQAYVDNRNASVCPATEKVDLSITMGKVDVALNVES